MAIVRLFILAVFSMSVSNLNAHAGHAALYKYQFQGKSIVLQFMIYKSDLDHFNLKSKCENFDTATALCIADYLNAHSTFEIDGQKVDFELHNSKTSNDTFILIMKGKVKRASYKSIKIVNSCFLEFDKEFTNRIVIKQYNSSRTFRMTNARRELNIAEPIKGY